LIEANVKTADEGGEDDSIKQAFKLFQIPPSGNEEPVCEEVVFTKLEKQLLNTVSSFVLDCGDEVWVWIGRKSNKHMRKLAEAKGAEIMARELRPAHATLHVMWEGTELVLFMEVCALPLPRRYSTWEGMLSPPSGFLPCTEIFQLGEAANCRTGDPSAPQAEGREEGIRRVTDAVHA
jgi:hypothetical protein